MDDLVPYRTRVVRRAWKDTVRLIEPKKAISIAIVGLVIGYVSGWRAGASTATALWIAAVAGVAAEVLSFVATFVVQTFAAPARLDGELRQRLATDHAQVAQADARAPRMTIRGINAHIAPDSFLLYVDLTNPGETTTIERNWYLSVRFHDGTTHDFAGALYPEREQRIDAGNKTGVAALFYYTKEAPKHRVVGHADLLTLTTSDVRGRRLKAEFRPRQFET
jgi:hypothetical protein